jgi:hypothetical protein
MRTRRAFILTVAVVVILSLTSLVLAQSPAASAQLSASYDLSWWTVDGGGGTIGDGAYALSGTAGQPDAGLALGGGTYTLAGGFWHGAEGRYPVYLPLVLR